MIKVKDSGYQFSSTVYSVKEVMNGKDVLTLTIPAKGEDAQHVMPESVLVEKAYSNSEFVIRSINGDDEETEITAELNLDDFNENIFEAFNKTGTPYIILNTVVPQGWTVVDRSGIRSSETIDLEAPTAEEIADSVINVFGVAIRYDFEHHEQIIYDPSSMSSNGQYLTKELNLVSLSRYQNSYDLRNRLYAYGKDGLSFADINDGKPYIDDMSYLKGRIRCYRIKDDRFTDKASLLEYAKRTIKEMSKPISSYECTPADIGATDVRYAFLKLELMAVVTLLDVDTNTRINHQVVEKTVWPYDKTQNSLTLSVSSPSFTSKLVSVEEQIQKQNGEVDKKIQDYVDSMTNQIVAASGGHVVINYGDDGKMAEILLMDTTDKATAVNVMRFNMGGIAFSTSGYNGPFNGIMGLDGKWFAQYLATWQLSASIIIAGILQSQDGKTFYLDLEKGILRMKATELTIEGKTVEEIADEAVNRISLSIQSAGSENIFDEKNWYQSVSTPEGVVNISGDIATITVNSEMDHYAEVNISKSTEDINPYGQTYEVSISYKIDQRIESNTGDNTINIWAYYDSGAVSTTFMKFSTASGQTSEVTEGWVTKTAKVQFKPEHISTIIIQIIMCPGSGSIQIKKPVMVLSVPKRNQLVLDKNGVVLSSATLDLSDYASQQDYAELKVNVDSISSEVVNLQGDYTSVKQQVDGLNVSVVKNGEVRTKFAADSSSVTISSGRITFTGNTLVVNSNNFKLNENGTVSITGSFYSSTSNDKVSIYNGVLQIDRKISDGSWRKAVAMFAYGTNASNGFLQLLGPNASGTGQYVGATLYCDYGGGTFGILNSAGQEKFRVLINGDGNAEVWVNGSQKF